MRLLVPLVCALYIAGCLAQYDDDVDDQEDDTGDDHDMGHDEGGAAEGGGGATGAAGTPITSFDYSDPYFPQSLSVALITVNDERICNGALVERAAGEKGHFVLTTADCVWDQGYALNGENKKLFQKKKEFHMSGDWRIKEEELSEVKVEFGVTPDGEPKTTCQVQDIRINSYWPMDTAAYHDPTHRRHDFAVLVLADGCEGEQLDGAAYMPFAMIKPTLASRSPKHFVRAAYTEERQLMAYPETWLANVEKYGVKSKGATKGITQQIGAPVFVRQKYMVPSKKGRAAKKRKPMKKAPFLFGMYQVTNDKGAQITLRTASIQADVARLMKEGAGFSPLIQECAMKNVGAPVCWSECGPPKTCWVAEDGSKKKLYAKEKSRQTTKPCGLGDTHGSKVKKLCGKAKRGNGKAPKKKKTAAMMSWNGDEYEYGYEQEDVDDEAYAYEDEDADAEMYGELDEMFNAMFIAGYKQGVQEQQNKRRYRYQD